MQRLTREETITKLREVLAKADDIKSFAIVVNFKDGTNEYGAHADDAEGYFELADDCSCLAYDVEGEGDRLEEENNV